MRRVKSEGVGEVGRVLACAGDALCAHFSHLRGTDHGE